MVATAKVVVAARIPVAVGAAVARVDAEPGPRHVGRVLGLRPPGARGAMAPRVIDRSEAMTANPGRVCPEGRRGPTLLDRAPVGSHPAPDARAMRSPTPALVEGRGAMAGRVPVADPRRAGMTMMGDAVDHLDVTHPDAIREPRQSKMASAHVDTTPVDRRLGDPRRDVPRAGDLAAATAYHRGVSSHRAPLHRFDHSR